MPGPKKIFIAEDDQHFCELYQMALGTEGYEVHCAYNGKDALAMIPQQAPDLIILDVMMPEVDGYEVCQGLRELPQFALTPIIMLTALSTDDEKIKGYNVGADDYLTKPFPLKVLKAKVKSLIERRAANKVDQPMQAFEPTVPPPQQPQSTFQPSPVIEQPMPVFEPPPPPAEPPTSTFQPPPPLEEPPKPVPQQSPPVVEQPTIFTEALPQPTAPQPTAPQPTVIREVIREQTPAAREEFVVLERGTPLTSITPEGDYFAFPFLGAVPQGSNILVTGGLGCGKSRFSHLFLGQGLETGENGLFICLDDDPSFVRKELVKNSPNFATLESQNRVCFVDAYSCGGKAKSSERFAIRGPLDLSDLSTLISEAGATVGQTDQQEGAGRRVIDSISSLFLNFDLPYVQRFLAFMARSGHFAGVSTIFVVEEGTLDDQSLNNIKYIMDGVLEFRRDKDRFLARAQTLKWTAARPEWSDITPELSG
ncbi:MAG: response regulator [Candidatus Binatia bacterium]